MKLQVFVDTKTEVGDDYMKKILAVMITFSVLMFSTALAADGALPDMGGGQAPLTADVFTFRNGIQWNMAAADVQTLEPVAMIERTKDLWSVLYPQSRVEVSMYFADMTFMFYQNQLKMISYDFGSDAASGSYQYLTGALTSVYGQNTDTDPLEIVSAMDRIYPGYYTADRLSQVYGWRSGDGTAIYLYYYADSSFAILYVSPDIVSSGTGNYVTTGL